MGSEMCIRDRSISDGLRVRIKFMGQYGRPNLALVGFLVEFGEH